MKSEMNSVAYVDVARVLNDPSLASPEAARLKQVRKILLKAENGAMDAYKDLPEAEKQNMWQADSVLLGQLWQQEQVHARTETLKAIGRVAEDYRKHANLGMIISKEQVLAAGTTHDVTEEILARLAGMTVDYGKLPEVSVNKDANKPVAGSDAVKKGNKGMDKQ